MAKNLLITNLPADINQILDDYKAANGMRENTKASMGMMREYPALKATVTAQADRIRELEERLGELLHHLKQWQAHEKMVLRTMKDLRHND